MSEYCVSSGLEGQHRCNRCRTFVESYDLMIGILTTTLGVTGTRYWVHLDCLEQGHAQALVDALEELLEGYGELPSDDQTLVSESLQDLSQGLNLHRWEKKRKEGRTKPLHKHQHLESNSNSSSSDSTSAAKEEEEGETSEKKVLTPWYTVAQQKKAQGTKTTTTAKAEKKARTTTTKQDKTSKATAKRQNKKDKKQTTNDKKEDNEQEGEGGEGEGIETKNKEEADASSEDNNNENNNNSTPLQLNAAPSPKKKIKTTARRSGGGGENSKKPQTAKRKAKKQETKEEKLDESTSAVASASSPPVAKVPKKRKVAEPLVGGPDKAKTDYWYFCASKRSQVEQSNPHLGAQAINQELSSMWKSLDAADRAEFEDYHMRDKKRYARQLQEFMQYGNFTVEIEQIDDENILESLHTQRAATEASPHKAAQEKQQTQTNLKELFTLATAEEDNKKSTTPLKKPASFHKGALRPVSRLL